MPAEKEGSSVMTYGILNDYKELDLPVREGKVQEEVRMIPMRDGMKMKTHIFHMEEDSLEGGQKQYSVILQRSPYVHAAHVYRTHGEQLAKRGFVYVIQWCRGVGGSEGIWNPNENERDDGLDTVNYFAALYWVKNIGFWGDSYLALTGWCMADAVPDKVKGMYLGVYGTDRFCSMYEKGLFRHDVFTSWAMENAGVPITADYRESCCYRPHYEVDESLWGVKLPWYREWVSAVREKDSYWQEGFWKMLREMPEKVKIPVYIREGWYDHHLGSAVKSYEALCETAKQNSTLQIGCWNHHYENVLEWCKAENLQCSEVKSMVKWFQEVLLEEKLPEGGVDIYMIGADCWIRKKKWPLNIWKVKKLYLSGGLRLTSKEGRAEEIYEYEYDPYDPVDSYGAEAMLHDLKKAGSLYQPDPNYRSDVISFISEPLEKDFDVVGKIKVHLTVSSDCRDTAFTAKLMEEVEDGKYVNIRSSITTILAEGAGENYRPGDRVRVCVDMWDIAWKLKKGHRLRLDISSSDFPQYALHSNYSGVWSRQIRCRTAHQRIFAGGENSWVELPLVQENQ